MMNGVWKIVFGILLCGLLLCAGAAAEDVWITIEPVQTPASPDAAYHLSGSTNAPDDTPIVISIYRTAPGLSPTDAARITELPRIFTSTLTAGGSGPVRSWSVPGPVPQNMMAGNFGYMVAAFLAASDETPLATAVFPAVERWATADPVPDRTTGKTIRLSGTTNIPPGETVFVEVARVAESEFAGSRIFNEPVFRENVTVLTGEENTWTTMMNTAGFSPGVYAVNLKNVLYQQGPRFLLEPEEQISPWWLTMDPLADTVIGKPFTLSGATNLAAGTSLDIGMKSSSLLTVDPAASPKAFSGKTLVQEGKAGVNFWSVGVDIHNVPADQYEITVTDAGTGTRLLEYVNLCTDESLSGTPAAEYLFTMNEVRYPGMGRPYVFSGSTTAPPGTMIVTEIYRIDSTVSGTPEDVTAFSELYELRTLVREGSSAVNHWVAESVSVPERLGEENVRYVARAYPEGILLDPAVRTVPGSGNWTTTDPVPDAVTGAELHLSGQTNLPAGEIISVELYTVVWSSGPAKKPAEPVWSAKTVIEKDSTWSAVVNTTEFSSGRYTVVAAQASYLSGPVFSLGLPGERQWITVDPVPFVAQNDSFVLSGTTGLDEGMQLLIEVLPQYFVEMISAHDSGSYSITSAMSSVTNVLKGENGRNTWSVPVSTQNWKADTYRVLVSALEVELSARDTFILWPAGSVPPTDSPLPSATQTPGLGTGILALAFGLAVLCSILRRN